jgi:hypothetical protein
MKEPVAIYITANFLVANFSQFAPKKDWKRNILSKFPVFLGKKSPK